MAKSAQEKRTDAKRLARKKREEKATSPSDRAGYSKQARARHTAVIRGSASGGTAKKKPAVTNSPARGVIKNVTNSPARGVIKKKPVTKSPARGNASASAATKAAAAKRAAKKRNDPNYRKIETRKRGERN
tara:strand:+ start:237 stop:629 length:393 start_codon:yes stop_codon:yes gene_type:complete